MEEAETTGRPVVAYSRNGRIKAYSEFSNLVDEDND